MSTTSGIGSSTPPTFSTDDANGNTDDNHDNGHGGLGGFNPTYHEIDPPYCPGKDDGKKWHLTAHLATGIFHPALAGTQVGSEG